MSKPFDLVVIGGGPAGSAAAITAARGGARVVQLEKGMLPRQRVCGEFVSPESLQLISFLLRDHELLAGSQNIPITRLFVDDEVLILPVAPAGASITRYDLDEALWQAAIASGVECRQQAQVRRIIPGPTFRVETADESFEAKAVMNAA